MNSITILYFLLIRPLELIYELIFSVCYQLTGSAVLSIVFLSITVGLLCLPLYTRADALQAEANVIENKLKPWRTEIKKNFKGDEQVMMLQAYYRENNYHPLMMMRSSISLLLQIPFFISAYHMLSSSVALQGTSFGPIADLGAPDGIIKIGAFAINLLPILMTAINIISGTIYSKDLDKKSKIQLYVTALVFLFLLYNSPSGLVLYWTLNNVFSLVKNIVMKLVPASKKPKVKKQYKKDKLDNVIFVLYGLCISVIIGLLIPSDTFSSVGDFLTNYHTINLSHYLIVSLLISLGFFIVWGGIYYLISNNKTIVIGTMIALACFSVLNYFAFYRYYGQLNRYLYILTYTDDSFYDRMINLIILFLTLVLIYIVIRNTKRVFIYAGIIMLVPILFLSIINIDRIIALNKSYSYVEEQRDQPVITLSQNEPNVIVIMLDRSMGRLVPFIINEHPELEQQFDGFTYYYNSLSLSNFTVTGTPALFGGYDYTPSQMNARSDISLQDKHNEALRVLPTIFGESNFNVTLIDPTYANYQWIPDLSIFDDYPYVNAYIANGATNPYFDSMIDDWSTSMERNLFAYSFRTASPLILRNLLYDNGFYNDLNRRLSGSSFFQSASNESVAIGMDFDFLNSYSTLLNLGAITSISNDSNSGSFVLMANETTHEPELLAEPEYSLTNFVDNTSFDELNQDRFNLENMSITINTPEAMGQYSSQVAAFMALGNWFDYLREQGVYDNTRIILVSDHGASSISFNGALDDNNLYRFNCLLMVKDFGDTGFTVSDELMVNAEVPYIAVNNLIDNPVNPFTGNPITSNINNTDSFRYLLYNQPNPSANQGNTYNPGYWYSYNASYEDIFNSNAWEYQGCY